MRLRLLVEGFDLNKDASKYAEVQHAALALQDVIRNVSGSRISTVRRLLKNIAETINQVDIESDDEREHIDRCYSLISAIIDQLKELSDGIPPDDIMVYISMLSDSIVDFCRKYTRRGNDVN
jgi:hypothetical protein